MAKKRANGEGTIYQVKSRKWRVQFTTALGTRQSAFFDSQKECQVWLLEKKSSQRQGLDLKKGSLLFRAYVQHWLEIRTPSLGRNSVSNYRRDMDKVIPLLGHLPIENIGPGHISQLYDQLLHDGQTAYCVRKIHKTLSSAFNEAVRMKYLSNNPASGASLPIYQQKERVCLDENQVGALLLAAVTRNDRHYALYFTAIQTGMRQGELLGLKWDDINFEKAEISVRRQLLSWSKGEAIYGNPKSVSGKRAISFGIELEKVLSTQQEELATRLVKDDRSDLGLVFPASSGVPQNSSNLRRDFRSLIEFSGLPKISFHDLRHTSATLLLEAGVPITTVSKRLGHSKVSITMDIYSHTTREMEKFAASVFDKKIEVVAHGLHTNG